MSVASPLRQHFDRELTEDDMRAALVEAACIGGWRHTHIRDSRRQDVTGWPDDTFLRDGCLYLWELKRVKGKTTPAQDAWLATLNAFIEAHGLEDWMEARVIRPADLAGCIERLASRPGLKAEVA